MRLARKFLKYWFYLLGGITWSLIEIFDPKHGYHVYNYLMIKSGDFDVGQWLWKDCK